MRLARVLAATARINTSNPPTLFLARCIDVPDSGALRAEIRPRHLEFIESTLSDRIVLGGPLVADGAPRGSVLVLRGSSEAEIKSLLDQDPYVQGGLFAKVEIETFKGVATAETFDV